MKKICESGFKVSNADKKVFEHYLFETPEEWSKKALKGMINKAIKIIIKDYLDKFKETCGDSFPASLSLLLPAIIRMDGFVSYKKEANEKRNVSRKEKVSIQIWPNGFEMNDYEYEALNSFFKDPEQTLYDYMENKISLLKERFVKEYEKKLLKNPNIETIPSNQDDLINLITKKKEIENEENN